MRQFTAVSMALALWISGAGAAQEQQTTGQKDEPIQLEPVTVQAPQERDYRTEKTSVGTKTDAPILETPQSIQVVPRQVIEDQAPTRLRDIYQNVSGVQPAYTGNNVSALEGPIIRGFNVFNTFWNGFRLRGQAPTILANVQQVEVLKGPGSVLYGQQEPGGIVNIVTKKPLTERYHLIEQRLGSYDAYETLLDVTGPLTKDGSILYRLNGSFLNTDSFRDFVESERWFIAPALTWNIGANTRVTLEGSYSYERFLWDNGLVFSPAAFDPPFAPVVPIDRFLQEPGFKNKRDEWFASYRVEHRINKDWDLRHMFLFHKNKLRLNTFRLGNVFVDGGTGRLMVNRRFDATVPTSTEFSTALDSIYRFELGLTKHQLLTGVDFSYEPRDGNSQDGLRDQTDRPIDVLNPVYGARPSSFTTTSFFSKRWILGAYAQDQIKLFDDRLHLLFGGRYDYSEQKSLFVNPPSAPSGGSRSDGAFTFRGGVLYKLLPWLHPYFSYSQGFAPPFSTTPGGIDPETSEQFEVGFKVPLFGERLVGNLAFYNLTKDNVIGDSNNDGILENFGKLRSRGFEFDLTGKITPELNVIATYAYTDTKVVRSDFLPVGGRFINVPYNSASLWLRYDFAPNTPLTGLSAGSGVYLTSSRPGNNANQFELDGYARWDALLRYRWRLQDQYRLTAQVNVQNILDKEYFESSSGLTVFPGAPRSAIASLRFEF